MPKHGRVSGLRKQYVRGAKSAMAMAGHSGHTGGAAPDKECHCYSIL